MPGKHNQRGFTLIELIVVIILIGILGATAASRMAGRSSFDAYVARDQAISIARQIQITAMQSGNTAGQRTANPLRIIAGSSDTSSCMGLLTATSCPSRAVADSDSRILLGETSHVRFTRSATTPNILYFDLLGRPVNSEGVRVCDSGCQINLQSRDSNSVSFCINREGFMDEGACG